MSRATIISAATVLVLTAAAHAADVNLDAVQASGDWTGFYAGATVGLGAATVTDDYDFVQEFTFGAHGLSAGIKAGGNAQLGDMLLGFEAELSLTTISGEGLCGDPPCGGTGTNPTFFIDSMGSVRARGGALIDDFLLFGTLGAGFANATVDDPVQGGSDSQTHLGVLVGAGVETMVAPGISLFAEYTHGFYSTESYALVSTPDGIGFQTDTVQAGVNFHF